MQCMTKYRQTMCGHLPEMVCCMGAAGVEASVGVVVGVGVWHGIDRVSVVRAIIGGGVGVCTVVASVAGDDGDDVGLGVAGVDGGAVACDVVVDVVGIAGGVALVCMSFCEVWLYCK